MRVIAGFLSIEDPRMLATIEKIAAPTVGPCGFLYRYTGDDGLDKG